MSEDIGDMLADLARKMRFTDGRKKLPDIPEAEMSEARRKGWPEWMWDEHEQSEECRQRRAGFARTQCQPGEAIRRALEAEGEG